jgi:hypothetical protein
VGLRSWPKLANRKLRDRLDPCRPSRWTHGADGGKAREIGEKVSETRDPCATGKAMRLFGCRAVRLWSGPSIRQLCSLQHPAFAAFGVAPFAKHLRTKRVAAHHHQHASALSQQAECHVETRRAIRKTWLDNGLAYASARSHPLFLSFNIP